MKTIEVYQLEKDDFLSALKKITAEFAVINFIAKFSGNDVSSDFLCELWGIDKSTLSFYIKKEIVTPRNPGSSKYRFDRKTIFEMPHPRYKRFQ
ncbi:MAG: hypothetical protein WCO13_08075 [Bacteroidota bacterium]